MYVTLRYVKKIVWSLLRKAEIWYVDCSHKCKWCYGVMVGGRRPLMEDDLRWKTTFGGRGCGVEYDLWGKITIGGRNPSVGGK